MDKKFEYLDDDQLGRESTSNDMESEGEEKHPRTLTEILDALAIDPAGTHVVFNTRHPKFIFIFDIKSALDEISRIDVASQWYTDNFSAMNPSSIQLNPVGRKLWGP